MSGLNDLNRATRATRGLASPAVVASSAVVIAAAKILCVTLIAAACTGGPDGAGDSRGSSTGGAAGATADPAVVAMPPVSEVDLPPAELAAAPADRVDRVDRVDRSTVAVIDTDRQLGLIRDGIVSNEWSKFDAFPSPDRSVAVMTLGEHIEGIGPERPVMWTGLPDGEALAEQMMRTGSELTATSVDGTFAGFTTSAAAPTDDTNGGAIAGPRRVSDIEIISRHDGSVFRQELDGNFVPEAFSSRLTSAGIPALVFLLEYFPADSPRFYRVRVLSTETGQVSLPLNLRNKSEQVDERMAGFSRSQVVADQHGLLFTLYRGTIDGTPDGEPYAFVHTLDLADGVWCLDVDPRLELDKLDGSLAVGGDRLYVASANGKVGSFQIPSISDPSRSPLMEWVVDAVGPSGGSAPVMIADDESVHVVEPAIPGFMTEVDASGEALPPVRILGDRPTAVAWGDRSMEAIGGEWATFGDVTLPEWLDEIAVLVVDP